MMKSVSAYENLARMGLDLPAAPPRGGIYTPVKELGNGMAYCSGCGPERNGEPFAKGKLGAEISIEQGQAAAKNCMLNILAIIERDLGSLDRIKSFSKMLALVASSSDFYDQPKVADGASRLIAELFGEDALPARSAIGVNVLPGNIPVEIEILFELNNQ